MTKPLYIQIKENLLEEIQTKSPNDSIGSERTLSLKYNASRMTVRKTIDILVSEGYLYRNKNAATCVASRTVSKLKQPIDMIDDIVYEHKILYFNSKSADDFLANKLSITTEDNVVRMVKTNSIGQDIHSIDDIYYPSKVMKNTDIKSVNAILEFSKKAKTGFLKQTFIPVIVPVNFANALNMKIGSPIIMIESVVSDVKGSPIAFIRTYNNSNVHAIEFTI